MLRRLRDYAFITLQYLLPHHFLSRLMLRLTRSRIRPLKNLLMRLFIGHFKVAMDEAVAAQPAAYPDFNSFFTRALKPGARPLATEPGAILSPVDGAVSQLGRIEQQQIFQAKGHHYDLHALLGAEARQTASFTDGAFATLYLSPRDYHRIHMPVDGTLIGMSHVPGRLFSVNPTTVRHIPGLFARNERVVCLFDTACGPMAMILVGAIFVASIDTVWHGSVTPPSAGEVRHWDYREHPVSLRQGEEMGRFNMGSTVILLFGQERIQWLEQVQAGNPVRMGQLLGRGTTVG